MSQKQRRPRQKIQRLQAEIRSGAAGGVGFGARTGQIIRGALGRGAGGRFVRAAGRETLRQRNARLRAIIAAVRAFMMTPTAVERRATRGGSAGERSRARRLSAAERRAKNRRDAAGRIADRGWLTPDQANAFLAFIEGQAADEQIAVLQALGLLDGDGKLTRAGRVLKAAYDREKLDEARRALDMLKAGEEQGEKTKGVGDYRAALRSAIRGLWTGEFDMDDFFDAMMAAIDRHISLAWYAGARDCGILPDELTRNERIELQRAIDYEKRWILGLGLTIEENSRVNGGKLSPLFSRAEIWIGRWEGTRDKARAMACADKKLKWVVGGAKEHCGSCLKLSNKVKRASFWYENGILPRVHGADYLECNGFRCTCTLEPTNERATPGPLPNLP